MSHLPSELLIYLYLQKNGRTTRENIAKAIGVSEGAVTRAFHKMKDCNIQFDKKRNGFFIQSALSKEDVMPLIEGVLLSKLLSPEESEALIQKVWDLLPRDQTLDKPPHIKSYKTHRRNVVRDTLFEHIKVLYRARANTKTVTFQLQAQKFMDEALVARMAGTIRPDWAQWRISVYEENIRKFQTAMAQYLSGINS